jgi:hypothetical protein
VDFQVNLDRVFDAPKAHEYASQESFATGSTATSGTLAPDPAPDPEPIPLADDPPGAGRQDNAPRAPSYQITSEVSIPTANDGSAFSSVTAATPTTTLQTLQVLPSPTPQYTGRQGT